MTNSGTPEWYSTIVETTKTNPVPTSFVDEEVTVAITIGKNEYHMTVGNGAAMLPEEGAKVQVRIPMTGKQFDAVLDGSLLLSHAYMRGDIKPEGSSRALLFAVELFDALAKRSI